MLNVARQPPSENAEALCGGTGSHTSGVSAFDFQGRLVRVLLQLLGLLVKGFIKSKHIGVQIVSVSTTVAPRGAVQLLRWAPKSRLSDLFDEVFGVSPGRVGPGNFTPSLSQNRA